MFAQKGTCCLLIFIYRKLYLLTNLKLFLQKIFNLYVSSKPSFQLLVRCLIQRSPKRKSKEKHKVFEIFLWRKLTPVFKNIFFHYFKLTPGSNLLKGYNLKIVTSFCHSKEKLWYNVLKSYMKIKSVHVR